MKICGIDEAGRGAVIGPMVVAGVLMDHREVEELAELGVKDSKKLKPEARAQLSKLIRERLRGLRSWPSTPRPSINRLRGAGRWT